MSGGGKGKSGESLLERLRTRVEWAETKSQAAFAEALLKARAKRLAQPRGAVAEPVGGIDALGFRIGAERYGVPLEHLSEVMPLGSWTPVPGQPRHLLGVTNLRGEIRPVIDLHSLLSLDQPPEGARGWVIFIEHAEVEVGLRAEALERIAAVASDTLTRPHETANGLPQRFIAGIAADGLILLDIPQILALEVLTDSRANARRAS